MHDGTKTIPFTKDVKYVLQQCIYHIISNTYCRAFLISYLTHPTVTTEYEATSPPSRGDTVQQR